MKRIMNYLDLLHSLKPDSVLGIFGAGKSGRALLAAARARNIRVLVCDPPQSEAEAEELNDDLHQLWGNGMGGCNALPDPEENGIVFLPPDAIRKQADVIAALVPLTDGGRHPTRGMFSKAFLDGCRRDVKICNFSAPEIVSPDAAGDPRIILPYGTVQ